MDMKCRNGYEKLAGGPSVISDPVVAADTGGQIVDKDN